MKSSSETVLLHVKVTPNASRHDIVGWEGEVLKVRIAAAPERGKANEALIRYLAECLQLRRNEIHFLYGETSRQKCIQIDGMTRELLKARLKLYER